MTASTRLDDKPVRVYSQVTAPDIAVVLDESLLTVGGATAGLKPGGVVIVNTPRSASELGIEGDVRVVTADVTGAAEAAGVLVGGTPIVSAAILGSVAKATGVVTMESVDEVIRASFSGSAAEKNAEAARIAFECTSAVGA